MIISQSPPSARHEVGKGGDLSCAAGGEFAEQAISERHFLSTPTDSSGMMLFGFTGWNGGVLAVLW